MEEELKKEFSGCNYNVVSLNDAVKELYENPTIIFFDKEVNDNLQSFISNNVELLKAYSSRSGWNFLNINDISFSKNEDNLIFISKF